MEYEVRFYFSKSKLDQIILNLNQIKNLKSDKRYYEKTIQFDHPNKDMSFYSKEIDGRFRIRITKNEEISKCKISWKRRISTTTSTDINKEEEVEIDIKYEQFDNLLYIINKVLKMKQIESYERYRTIYYNDEIEIAVDEYPFGIALEIESKSNQTNPDIVIKEYVEKLNLNIKDAYRLSWDDRYSSLCKEQNIEQYKDVTFDSPMPEIKD